MGRADVNKRVAAKLIRACVRGFGDFLEFKDLGFQKTEKIFDEYTNTEIILAKHNNAGLLIFRGNPTFPVTFNDGEHILIPFEEVDAGIGVDASFLNVYRALRVKVINLLKAKFIETIKVVGHSLGAALATIAAVDIASSLHIKTSLCVFGSPRVGNIWFKKKMHQLLDGVVIYSMHGDPVVESPDDKEYVHVCEDRKIGNHSLIFLIGIVLLINKVFGTSKRNGICAMMKNDTLLEQHNINTYINRLPL